MENVWEYTRGNALSMNVWDSYTAILDACWTAWNSLMADTKRLTSTLTGIGYRQCLGRWV